jgi:hypothetical protein
MDFVPSLLGASAKEPCSWVSHQNPNSVSRLGGFGAACSLIPGNICPPVAADTNIRNDIPSEKPQGLSVL